MDPATMYLLYKLQNGPESAREFPFDSAAECESYRQRIPGDVNVIRYSCETYKVGSEPPTWYTGHFAKKLIHGVPLEMRHRPNAGRQ